MTTSTDIADHCDFINLPPELRPILSDGRWSFRLDVVGKPIVNFVRHDGSITTVIGIYDGPATWKVHETNRWESLAPSSPLMEGEKSGTWTDFIEQMEAARIAALTDRGEQQA